MASAAPTKYPCPSCPYRKDVPSGVWAPEEYDKLPAYDNDTPSHRLSAADYRAVVDYSSPVELFESGAAAAEHGRRDIRNPSPAACQAIDKLIERRARRQT
jgi:hypothetical protein